MRISVLSLFLLLMFGGAALGQQSPEVAKAFEAGFETRDDFDTLFNFISPREDENRWRQIAWIPSLWEGINAAQDQKKPLFIWAMNGDPLGCV